TDNRFPLPIPGEKYRTERHDVDLRVLHDRQRFGQNALLEEIVAHEQTDHLTPCKRNSLFKSRKCSIIWLTDNPKVWISSQPLDGPVGRKSVDYDVLERRALLRNHAFDRLNNQIGAVKCCRNDRDRWVHEIFSVLTEETAT